MGAVAVGLCCSEASISHMHVRMQRSVSSTSNNARSIDSQSVLNVGIAPRVVRVLRMALTMSTNPRGVFPDPFRTFFNVSDRLVMIGITSAKAESEISGRYRILNLMARLRAVRTRTGPQI